MKKFLLLSLASSCIVVLFLCFLLRSVQAQTAPAGDNTVNQQKTFTLQNPLKVNSIGEFIQNAVEIFSYLVILLAVLAFIWTGLQYILARGNTEKMKEATKRLGYIVIGVAIVLGARLLITVAINTLQATGTVNPKIIQSGLNAASGQ